jgi:hypothetical protein
MEDIPPDITHRTNLKAEITISPGKITNFSVIMMPKRVRRHRPGRRMSAKVMSHVKKQEKVNSQMLCTCCLVRQTVTAREISRLLVDLMAAEQSHGVQVKRRIEEISCLPMRFIEVSFRHELLIRS